MAKKKTVPSFDEAFDEDREAITFDLRRETYTIKPSSIALMRRMKREIGALDEEEQDEALDVFLKATLADESWERIEPLLLEEDNPVPAGVWNDIVDYIKDQLRGAADADPLPETS
jgi:hypothetical protein